jgi:uncharacterized protein YukE
VTVNPLAAARIDRPTSAWAGVWIAEDIELIAQGVQDGSWIDGTIGVVSAGLDGLALVSDPVGALLQYGIAWIIEHVKPLSDALDRLAGDPAQIAAHAQTWRNVANNLRDEAGDLTRSVRWDLGDWTGAAGDAYRLRIEAQAQSLEALARASDTMALMTEGAGMLIGTVRMMVRDAIAAAVSRLVTYAAELVATAGLAAPLVVEQVTTLCASWGARIADWLRSLISSLRRLGSEMTRLGGRIDQLGKLVNGRSGHGGADGLLHRLADDGIARNGTKILMSLENIRSVADKWGIDVRGVNVSINKSRDGLAGVTGPDGTVHLTRAAFRSEEELARTLEHERFHVQQIRDGMHYPRSGENTDPWEIPALQHEFQWWQNHPLNQPGGD